ncbi:MAG: 50S ribosomal protein L4 [candidate division NC10 bacterium]|nr:50S ribosomal protein L4 [candidate division NC10 bacterium]
MPQIAVVNLNNEKVDEVNLPDSLFGLERKDHLLHDTIRQYLANRRLGTASTKNRSAVSGGGRKPWRQKGTGRARAGSIRSPLWRKGGTVFGPTPRDYSYRIPKQVRRVAFYSALSEKLRENGLLVVDSVELERPSTKGFLKVLATLGARGKVLLAMKSPSPLVVKSARNLPGVRVASVEGINALDVCLHDTLILTRDALGFLEENAQR